MSRVAVAQMVSSSNIEQNLIETERLCISAVESEADLLVLPENFAFMGLNEEDKFKIAEEYGHGVIQDKVSNLAKAYGLWVIAGTIPMKTGGSRLKSSCIVFDDKGKHCARYDKIHLFDVRVSDAEVHKESRTIEPGNQIIVVDTPIGRVGLSVCYDLRFPELYQLLLREGAELFSVPSAFTALTGKAHWEVLLRARAIENLCYVLASNQGGVHDNGRETYGHSMVIEPWGNVLGVQKQGNGMLVTDVDRQRVHELRKQFPCNDHHVLNDKKVTS